MSESYEKLISSWVQPQEETKSATMGMLKEYKTFDEEKFFELFDKKLAEHRIIMKLDRIQESEDISSLLDKENKKFGPKEFIAALTENKKDLENDLQQIQGEINAMMEK